MARVEVELEDIPELENMEAEGSFGYTAEHAKWVNWDTSYSVPPPFDPIYGWVDRKWNDLDGGLKFHALHEDEEKAQEIASEITRREWKRKVTFMLMNVIESEGIEGVHFMERGAERAKADAEAIASVYAGSEDPNAGFFIVRDWLDYAFGISQDIVADESTDRGTLLQSGFAHAEQTATGNEWEEEGRSS